METLLDSNEQQGEGLKVTKYVINDLKTAAQWGNFLAIIQIIFIGLAMLMSLIALLASPIAGIIGLGIYGFMLYTAITLLQFGSRIKESLNSSKQTVFEQGIEKLGLWFKMIGISTIVIIALYIVMFAVLGTSRFFYRF